MIDLEPREVSGPLSHLQSAIASKTDTYGLLESINRVLPGRQLSGEVLKATFERWWPDLEQTLNAIASKPAVDQVPFRSDRNVLDEVLEILRAQSDDRSRAGERKRPYHVVFQVMFPETERRVSIAVGPDTTVRGVLDSLYTELRGQVPSFSYLEKWIVRGRGGTPRVVIREVQGRIPAQSVFKPGSEWEVVPLSQPYAPNESLHDLKSVTQ